MFIYPKVSKVFLTIYFIKKNYNIILIIDFT